MLAPAWLRRSLVASALLDPLLQPRAARHRPGRRREGRDSARPGGAGSSTCACRWRASWPPWTRPCARPARPGPASAPSREATSPAGNQPCRKPIVKSGTPASARGAPTPGRTPSAFLTSLAAPAAAARGEPSTSPGGAGRNAVWLAQRGLAVTLVDISDEALALARAHAARVGVALELARVPTWRWTPSRRGPST